jgi:hypothetical protein
VWAAPAPKNEKKRSEWQTLRGGLDEVRNQGLPAVVWYPGSPAAAGAAPGAGAARESLEEILKSTDLSRFLKRYVRIRLEPADLEKEYPPAVAQALAAAGKGAGEKGAGEKGAGEKGANEKGANEKGAAEKGANEKGANEKGANEKGANEKGKGKAPPAGGKAGEAAGEPRLAGSVEKVLRLPPGPPDLLILDFREQIKRRFYGAPVSSSALKKELQDVYRESQRHAVIARQVEARLALSRGEYRLGKVRQAVVSVRELEKPGELEKMDRVLRPEVTALIQKYRDAARRLLARADQLEKDADKLGPKSGQKYSKALKTLEKVAEEYPFADILEEVAVRKGRVFTKMTFTGPSR